MAGIPAISLWTLLPVMQAFDADFISLEYKDRSEEISVSGKAWDYGP
jgi:hypothetical protein